MEKIIISGIVFIISLIAYFINGEKNSGAIGDAIKYTGVVSLAALIIYTLKYFMF